MRPDRGVDVIASSRHGEAVSARWHVVDPAAPDSTVRCVQIDPALRPVPVYSAAQPHRTAARTVVVTATVPVQRYQAPACSRCVGPLRPGFGVAVDEHGYWSAPDADGSLVVQLDGGYGQAVDPTDASEYRELTFVLCPDCVPAFAAANPWLAHVLS